VLTARLVTTVVLSSCEILCSELPSTFFLVKSANLNLQAVVGFRMPYDLPLVPYSKEEEPWCATSNYNEPDWRGSTWGGFPR
jgi:hypothetical protein